MELSKDLDRCVSSEDTEMTNNNMKKLSALLVIKEMEMKTVRHYFISTGMAGIEQVIIWALVRMWRSKSLHR